MYVVTIGQFDVWSCFPLDDVVMFFYKVRIAAVLVYMLIPSDVYGFTCDACKSMIVPEITWSGKIGAPKKLMGVGLSVVTGSDHIHGGIHKSSLLGRCFSIHYEDCPVNVIAVCLWSRLTVKKITCSCISCYNKKGPSQGHLQFLHRNQFVKAAFQHSDIIGQEENEVDIYRDNIHRVNLFNVRLIWIFSFLLTVQAFVITGPRRGLLVLAITGATGLASTAMLVFKLHYKAASILIPLCPYISGTLLAIIEGGSKKIFIIYLVTACMAALYFDRSSLILYSVVQNILFIACNFFLRLPVLGNQMEPKEGVTQLVMMDTGIVVLYFLSKWSHEYFQKASANEKKSTELFLELQHTFEVIAQASATLHERVGFFMQSIETASHSSDSVTQGIQDMAKGTSEEAAAILAISDMMREAHTKLSFVNEQSKAIESISAEVKNSTHANRQDVDNLKEEMSTIRKAVEQGLQTMNDLGKTMEHVNEFIESINGIAQQTNLLAVNAAIEASRAGEAGTGFAVVAQEIRNLSAQSNQTSDEISTNIESLTDKAAVALEISQQGTSAVLQGFSGVERLSQSILQMSEAFEKMQRYIEEEYSSIDHLTALFNRIEQQLSKNAAIMQEHSATSEEITAIMSEQNVKMNEMVDSVREIERLSDELKKLAESK